jgi:hypothetical protein
VKRRVVRNSDWSAVGIRIGGRRDGEEASGRRRRWWRSAVVVLAVRDGGGGAATAPGGGLAPAVAAAPTIEVRVVGGPTAATSSGESSSYRSLGGGGRRGTGDWLVMRRGGEAVGAPPRPRVDGGRQAGLMGRSAGEASGAEVTSSGGGGDSRRRRKLDEGVGGGRTDYPRRVWCGFEPDQTRLWYRGNEE